MDRFGLSEAALTRILDVLSRHPEVTGALVYGSRATGNERPNSDIDLALEGVADPLKVQAIANELDELPLPYRFDVTALASLRSPSLREEIARTGVRLYG